MSNLTIEDIILGSHFAQMGYIPDFVTVQDEYAIVCSLPVLIAKRKKLVLSCTGNDLLVVIRGDIGNGMYSEIAVPEFSLTAGAPALDIPVEGVFAAIQVWVKPAAPGMNGTLSTFVNLET